MALHADEIDSSKLAGHNIRKMTALGVTSGQVAGATDHENFESTIDGIVVHADMEDEKKVVKDGLDLAYNLGDIDDTSLQAATTVEGLADLTQATDDEIQGGPTVLD